MITKKLVCRDGVIDEEKEKSIYFIQEGENGNVKIGISKNPKKRMEQLQSANPHELKLRVVIDDCHEGVEDDLHHFFKNYHIRGEWFESPVIGILKYEIEDDGEFDIFEKIIPEEKVKLNPNRDFEKSRKREKWVKDNRNVPVLLALYDHAGWSLEKISEFFGVSKTAIHHQFEKNGIERRDTSHRERKKIPLNKKHLQRLYKKHEYNMSDLSRFYNVSHSTISRKMQEYNLKED